MGDFVIRWRIEVLALPRPNCYGGNEKNSVTGICRGRPFEQKAELVARLGIKILPSEDMTSRKTYCLLNLAQANKESEQASFAQVTLSGPWVAVGRTFRLEFALA